MESLGQFYLGKGRQRLPGLQSEPFGDPCTPNGQCKVNATEKEIFYLTLLTSVFVTTKTAFMLAADKWKCIYEGLMSKPPLNLVVLFSFQVHSRGKHFPTDERIPF